MTIPIINPSHYSNLKIQPVTYTMLNNFQFWRGNIIKYASRAGFKLYTGKSQIESEIIDLEKTMKCCKIRIQYLKDTQIKKNNHDDIIS